MAQEAAYDCQRCGACCGDQQSSGVAGYVYLERDESRVMKRLGLSVVSMPGQSFLGTRSLAGETVPFCVAFRGRVGSRCRCSIYQHRPRNCRAFEVGGPDCREARALAGLPA